MIDFVKIQIYGLPVKEYFNNPLLDFHSQFSEKTGEVKPNHEADYSYLWFTIIGSSLLMLKIVMFRDLG